jgi:hypothetical protein
MFSTTSTPIEAKLPWQKHIPFAGLDDKPSNRSKAPGEIMI